MIAFNRGVPPPESFPLEQLADCGRQVVLTQGQQVLQYGSAFGYEPLREWIAAKFHASVENVIIGQGSLQLLDHLTRSWLHPEDLVFVEQPTYDRTLTIFKRAGLRLRGYPLINGCIDLDAMEADLRSGQVPKIFYLIPDFQNPSGALMPEQTRQRLAELAERFNFMLVEDGPYRELRYVGQPLPTLKEICPQRVLHMSSFSKLISPGMRVGYMVGSREIVAALGSFAQQTYISPSGLDQAMAFEFIHRGWMAEHVTTLKALYRPRLQALLDGLTAHFSELGAWIEPQGGFYVGITLGDARWMPNRQDLEQASITLSDNQGFFLKNGETFIRLPFCALTPEQIDGGVAALRSVIRL